jgi:hypothetical protein
MSSFPNATSNPIEIENYAPYKGLPPLAGLCSMERAVQCIWSVEQSADRLKRLHYVLKRLYETFTARITAEPIYELKTAFSHHAYICSEQVTSLRKRVSEMREPPLGLERVPHLGLERLMDESISAPTTEMLLLGLYEIVIPSIRIACQQLAVDAHPLADAPTVRIARLMDFELQSIESFGKQAIECLVDDSCRMQAQAWLQMMVQCLGAAGGLDGTLAIDSDVPSPVHSATPYQYEAIPRRDERFVDPFNAGVNPEAFLYAEAFAARDKTLMMYYKRLREIDVPEMMASILYELRDKPWDFHAEMCRQLWDEARHAMMGEVGFASLRIDWTKIPINFTWSRNLNTQLTAQERHGVLFFIEQGLMPKTGKRYEWEVGVASGSPLSALFQDFDWADEVLHAQIGRRWYVPQFKSLVESLQYGDECWSKVVSHWAEYRSQGMTEHRNWWPDLYRAACERWQVQPDPAALAFDESYESRRADLKELSS